MVVLACKDDKVAALQARYVCVHVSTCILRLWGLAARILSSVSYSIDDTCTCHLIGKVVCSRSIIHVGIHPCLS